MAYDWRASCSTARTVLDPVCSNQGVMKSYEVSAVVHQVNANNYARIRSYKITAEAQGWKMS